MEVYIDNPNEFQKQNGRQKQNGCQKTKWPPNTKLSITHSFLELQRPDFAWMFVWRVRTNSKNKMGAKKQNGRHYAPANKMWSSENCQYMAEGLQWQTFHNTKTYCKMS